MATNLWGNVFYRETFAGILSQEAGGRCVFSYDESYMQSSLPAISYALPLRPEPHLTEHGLHHFFDNLCAEGWLKDLQACALGLRRDDRFPLLLPLGQTLQEPSASLIQILPRTLKSTTTTRKTLQLFQQGRLFPGFSPNWVQ